MGIGTLRRYHDNDEGRPLYQEDEAPVVISEPVVATQSPAPVITGEPKPTEQSEA